LHATKTYDLQDDPDLVAARNANHAKLQNLTNDKNNAMAG